MIGQKASKFLAGIGTDPKALEALDQAAAKGQGRTLELLHYKRNGSAFCDQVNTAFQRNTWVFCHDHICQKLPANHRRRLCDACIWAWIPLYF